MTGTTPGILGALAQEPTTQDREAESSRLEEQVHRVLSDLILRIGLDPSLGSDTAEAKQALDRSSSLTGVLR